jgi:Co/Zn/Cd efflux system component
MEIMANADAKKHYFGSGMLGWLGVILAAHVVIFTGWKLSDPIFGAGIGVFIAPRTSPAQQTHGVCSHQDCCAGIGQDRGP